MNAKISLLLAGILALAAPSRASIFSASLVNEPALAYSNTYPVDLKQAGVTSVSAKVAFSALSLPAVTFGDGAQAQGSLTVTSYAALVAAAATNTLTVNSTTGIQGTVITLPGHTFQYGIDWAGADTVGNAAVSLAAAIHAAMPFISTSVTGGVITLTAPAGAYYNSMSLVSSNPSVVAAGGGTFTGGADDASVRINGQVLTQGLQWTAATSNNATATSLASAVTAALGGYLTATPSTNSVNLKAKANGALYNFALASSLPAGLSVSGATMTGGLTPAFTLGSGKIAIPAHGLTTGLQVLYTAGSTLGGLTNQTTYYAVPLDANTLGLASSLNNAKAGTYITITSSPTHTAQLTATLAPLALTGTPQVLWEVSDDLSTWYPLQAPTVTFPSPYTAATTYYSFGYIGPRYLRLNATGPTTGGAGLKVDLVGTN